MVSAHSMKVFISYSDADKKWADALRSGLTDAGFEVTVPADDIEPGENWHLELGKALDRANAMVVLLSPDSVASRHIRAEIEFALVSPHFRDRLIPVLVKPTDDVPWILRKQRFIRATKNVDETVHRVVEALQQSPVPVGS
jgi:hypothetical protein